MAAQRRKLPRSGDFFAFWLVFELIVTKFSAVFDHGTAGSSSSICSHRHARMHSHHTLLEAAKGRATGRSKTPCRVTVGWAISCSTAVRTTLGAARRLGQQHDGSLCAAALLLALLQCNQSPMQSISNAVSNAISNATVVNRCSCSRTRRAHDTLMSARVHRRDSLAILGF